MASTYGDMLQMMVDRPQEMVRMAAVICDKESVALLKKMAGPGSPLRADELPYGRTGTKLSNLVKIQMAAKMGLVSVEEKRNGTKVVAEYRATDSGRLIVKNLGGRSDWPIRPRQEDNRTVVTTALEPSSPRQAP